MNHYHLRSLAQIYNLCNLTVKANPNTDLHLFTFQTPIL
jgi:hypothetical protein